MSCRQDSCPVLKRHSYDPCIGVCEFQLVANGGGKHIAWRHLTFLGVGPHGNYRMVVGAINLLSAYVKIVSCNAVNGRSGAGIDAGMTYGGHCWNIAQVCVVEAEPLV